MRTETTDVLVVGAGNSGLTAVGLLARLGISTIALSRHPGTAPQPRGSFTNQRTVEVLRDLGLEDEIHRVGTPLQTIGHNVMATSFTGQEIFRYRSYGTGERLADYWAASPCQNYNAHQNVLEPVLLDGARKSGADIRFMHELVSIEQTADEIVASILDRESGEEYIIRAKFAIGADGARSRVAEQVGVPFKGESALNHMLNAWIEVDLTEHVAYRPAGQYIMLQPGGDSWVGSGTFVTVAPWTEWVLAREYDPSSGEPDRSDESVIETVRTLVGDPAIPVKVKGTSKWQVNNLVAQEYRRGRVFLAGDAAHRHTPSGGLGTNTSIQDSFNLAWKLAYVIKGWAGEGLLDSYDQERQPVGKQVVDRAMTNLKNKALVGQALGLRRDQSAAEGNESLRSLFSDEPGAAERRAKLVDAVALQHGRSNAHGVDIGQRYTSVAVVDDGTPFPEPTRDPDIYYHPTTHSGAYLPHVWLEKDRESLSTLDLAGHGRFCLIVGIGGSPWREAAESLSAELGIKLPVYSVGFRCEYDDVVGEWTRMREIDDRGALLVRPDRHIAWRALTRPDSPTDALGAALRQALDRT